MRALVISGGGSKGAFAGGVSEYLIRVLKKEYDIFVGTSTGSLLIPFLALGEIDRVKNAYVNVTQDDVYSVCPFKVIKQKDGGIKTSINHVNVLRMFLRKEKTFGDHRNLRKTITRLLNREDFERLKASPKKVIVTASNLTTSRAEYKYLHDFSYEDFCDWMWISCSYVPFMNVVRKNGFEYADGGFGNFIPIEGAIDAGAVEVDVIVLKPRNPAVSRSISKNAFEVIVQCIQFMFNQIAYSDIQLGQLESIYNEKVKVNFIFTPNELTQHSYYFDKEFMTQWWEEGYNHAENIFS